MRKFIQLRIFMVIINLLIMGSTTGFGQVSLEKIAEKLDSLKSKNGDLQHRLDILEKSIDDLTWFQRVGTVAFIDKVYLTGPPLQNEKNPTGLGAGNPVKFWAYIFLPKDIDFKAKYPLIVFPHGGVHSNFSSYYTHIVKELVAQQYIIIAAEYRGSTGYGKSHYQKIDYGGLEIEDVKSSRDYVIDNYNFVDKNRVGIIGWSHGGLITLLNVFEHPEDYQVAFAGVPVSDLIARMGYYDDNYRNLYSANYHIGKTAHENVNEYRKRSPVWNTHKLKTPLLIHTNTNDEDVNVLEVEHLIKSLKAEGKKFEYEIFKDIPGGHSFDRMDTRQAKEIRIKIYNFLSLHLQPPRPIKSLEDINKAAYR